MQASSDHEYTLIGRMVAPTGQGEGLGLNDKEHGGRRGGNGGRGGNITSVQLQK